MENTMNYDNFMFCGYSSGTGQDNKPFYTLAFMEIDLEKNNYILQQAFNPQTKAQALTPLKKFNLEKPFVDTLGLTIGDRVQIAISYKSVSKPQFAGITKIISKSAFSSKGK